MGQVKCRAVVGEKEEDEKKGVLHGRAYNIAGDEIADGYAPRRSIAFIQKKKREIGEVINRGGGLPLTRAMNLTFL